MKLLIAVPTLDTVPVDFLESLSKLIIRLKDDGVDFTLKIEAGTLVYFEGFSAQGNAHFNEPVLSLQENGTLKNIDFRSSSRRAFQR